MTSHAVWAMTAIFGSLAAIGVSVSVYEALGWKFERGDENGPSEEA